MKKAAIYMRVSTQNQEDEQTIENQKMELVERIKNDGNQLLSNCIYQDEAWSGTILERPGLDNLRADAKDKKFEILYFYDRGRIARKLVYQEVVFEELRGDGIELVGLHDINGDSMEELMMGKVMGIFHEYERLKITERMRIGKIRKVRENKKLLGYNPKYGYIYLPRIKTGEKQRDGKFVINKEQAEVVKMIFEWAASGLTKYGIQRKLYENNIAPPKGKRKEWSCSVIDRMLLDSTYMGEHYYNKSESVEPRKPRNPDEKYRKNKKNSRRIRPKEEWLMVKVPAIISPELFKAVQDQRRRNKRARSNNKKHNYLVAGLIDCSCGLNRVGECGNNCLYYRCTDRIVNRMSRQCELRAVNAKVLDNEIWCNLKQLLTQPELLLEHAKRWQSGSSPLQTQLEVMQAKLAGTDDEERRYVKMHGAAMMSEHIYKENIAELNEKRAQYVEEINALNDEIANKPTIPLEKLIDGVIKLVEDLDFSNQRQIVQQVITKIVATKEEVTVWGLVPVLATEQVGLNGKHRNRRTTKRR